MTTREVLEQARAFIEQGWSRRTLEGMNGNVCAIGAIKRAAGLNAQGPYDSTNTYYRCATRAVARTIAKGTYLNFADAAHRVVQYNDNSGRTKECVLAAFDAAIEKETP